MGILFSSKSDNAANLKSQADKARSKAAYAEKNNDPVEAARQRDIARRADNSAAANQNELKDISRNSR